MYDIVRAALKFYIYFMFKVIHPNRWFIWCLVVIFCAFVFIEWQIYLLNINQEQSFQQVSETRDLTSSWKTFKSERLDFEFRHPEDLVFEEDSDSGYVGTNFINDGYNNIYLKVWDVVEGRNQMDSLKYREANFFAPEEVNFQNGKFIVRDGYGTENYYFVNAYYDGGNYVYAFEMSRPVYSPELLKTFVEILTSVKSID